MKKLISAIALAALLVSCAPKEQAPAAPAKAKFGSWGYDAAYADPGVKAGDDFWKHALGGWLKTATIPPDRTFTGIDLQLIQQAESDVKALIEEAAAGQPKAGTNAQKIGDFYGAYMDEATIEKVGVEPIRRDLQAIDEAKFCGVAARRRGHAFQFLYRHQPERSDALYRRLRPGRPLVWRA
jgi:putative endopeptidase